MRLGRVIGPVWGARHAAGLDGAKMLEVAIAGGRAVAVDALGAGPGELVLVAHGSRVRDLTVGETVCDKDVVMAIVDGVDGAEDGWGSESASGGPIRPQALRSTGSSIGATRGTA